jgi:SAM domain (Sterile alpha motif)
MHDLAHWLEELGMSEYAQRFAENGIDISVGAIGTIGTLNGIHLLPIEAKPIIPIIGAGDNAFGRDP